MASITAAARKPNTMKRCTMTFSIRGMWAKSRTGSHSPLRSPSEQATQRANRKP